MDRSEGDDDDNNSNIFRQTEVSKCLIETFSNNERLEDVPRVLMMIMNNLVFDDPGILSKAVIFNDDERRIQDDTVMWLINQVIYVFNKNVNA